MNRLLPTPRRLLVADHPKARRRVLAHVEKRMTAPDGSQYMRFLCVRCGWAGWDHRESTNISSRGIPCPKCNPAEVTP